MTTIYMHIVIQYDMYNNCYLEMLVLGKMLKHIDLAPAYLQEKLHVCL